MNKTKIQYSAGDNGHQGGEDAGIYHNIKDEWSAGAGEIAFAGDPGWIFTKNTVIKKAVALFAALADQMTGEWQEPGWPPAARNAGPKISKGENYLGLPWVVLDHPRLFARNDVFAIRTLFWWGHYFSVTLHLKGIYHQQWLPAVTGNIPMLAENKFSVCIAEDEWRHELSMDNYLPLADTTPGEIAGVLQKQGFLKLSARAEIGQWNDAPRLLLNLYKCLLRSLDL